MKGKGVEIQNEVDGVLSWIEDENGCRFGEEYKGLIFLSHKESLEEILTYLKENYKCKVNLKRRSVTFEDTSKLSLVKLQSKGRQEEQAYNFAGCELTSVCYTMQSFFQSTEHFKRYIFSRLRSSCIKPSRMSVV